MMALQCRCGQDILLDEIDFFMLREISWGCDKDCNIPHDRIGTISGRIFSPNIGEIIDHVDRNTYNNQRNNLRSVTVQESNWNRGVSKRNISGFKGVCYRSDRTKKWKAAICKDGKTTNLGSYHSDVEAAKAYDKAARELFGKFAVLNFPEV